MSIILASFTAFVVTNAPAWLASLRGPILGKSQELAVDKSKELVVSKSERLAKRLFHLDEKEQLRHLEQALKNATERGLATFHTLQERDRYKDILYTLSQSGPSGEALRQEVMQFFTLEENPDLVILNDIYNRRQHLHDANYQDIDVALYLSSFFSALIGELYADPYFRPQLSDVLQQRANASMQHSLLDIVGVLKNIDARLDDDYSAEDFARDVDVYTTHIERTLHNLKIIGVVPKDQNVDPEISSIFVPLRIALSDQRNIINQAPDTIVAALEQSPCMVLLGGPGSGKSTAVKHLAWSHAAVNQSPADLASIPLLSGNPLPLRIELRRLNEERKRGNYDFLSFTTDVLLKREGIEINPQMFKELLTRRCLLLLFDGLDEVATLNERLDLVNEIEHFALSYPGNRILVTSRPVGYDLSRISHPLFTHAEVQNFDEQQIQQFLLNWYTAVLRLSPIPQREQEELNLLLTTLKGNLRLHKLAENPLLLTVIIQLHRYERLPDRRVLVYDRCADLLLETWAKLRGTNARWQDMKMVKEDQYACVAYLGFVLHERSQEEQPTSSKTPEEIAVDVSSRFLYNCVEDFLKKRELIIGVAEQRLEARRFIELVQEETGLIVERGAGENNEPLYGFVHRTFQEYFAAADVYERYLQEEASAIISEFLRARLHDPHWREVILLLLGKLKSKPVTNQLRLILEGKTQSLRSRYTDIVQQDLFFVCDCLIEEIKVENSLIELIVSRLCNIVRNSRFPSQRREALKYLAKLTKTRQYAGQGKKDLVEFAANDNTLDVETELYAIQVLYLYTPASSEERRLADQDLRKLMGRTDLSVDQVRETALSLYNENPEGSEDQQLGRAILTTLLEKTDMSVEQMWETAMSLYSYSSEGSDARQQAITNLTKLVEKIDLSAGQIREMAESLFRYGSERLEYEESELWQLATRMLIRLLERTDLSVEQVRETALSLYESSPDGSDARQRAITILMQLMERTDLSLEQVRETAMSLYSDVLLKMELEESELWQLMTTTLMRRVETTDLSVEQARETAMSLYKMSSEGPDANQRAMTILTKLLERTDLAVEQVRETALSLYKVSPEGSDANQRAIMILTKLVDGILSVEQVRETAENLYDRNPGRWDAEQLATTILTHLLERADLSVEQVRETALSLYRRSPEGSDVEQVATMVLTHLLERTDLLAEQMWETAESLYDGSSEGSDVELLTRTTLTKLVERTDLSVERALATAESFYTWGFKKSDIEMARAILTMLVKRSDLTSEQVWITAERLYSNSSEGADERLSATSIMLTLLSRADKPESKSDVYEMLRSMVPQFHKIVLVEGRS